MYESKACPSCLRRSWLIAALAPSIERMAGKEGSDELLHLSDEALIALAEPSGLTREACAQVYALDERSFTRVLEFSGCWAICRHDENYPAGLRELPSAPWALIGRGDIGALAGLEPNRAVGVIGTTHSTGYGQEIAAELGAGLARGGLTVVASTLFGIDSDALEAAVEGGGSAIAVVGSGVSGCIPPYMPPTGDRVVEAGALVSEFPPGFKSGSWGGGHPWAVRIAGRILAALSGATVVVEGGRHSRALFAARSASQLGRPVGAVPDKVTSRASLASNQLLAAGAFAVRGETDVFDAIGVSRPKDLPALPVKTGEPRE
jgi:DNA processing protein